MSCGPEGDLLSKDKQALIKQWITGGGAEVWRLEVGRGQSGGQPHPPKRCHPEPQLPKESPSPITGAQSTRSARDRRAGGMPLAQDTNLVEVDLNIWFGDHVENTQPRAAPTRRAAVWRCSIWARTKVDR